MSNAPAYCMAVLLFAVLGTCIYIQKSDFDKLAELYAVHPPLIVTQVDMPPEAIPKPPKPTGAVRVK